MRFDAVIVGGGAAGLSAALYLGRFRRHVLIVDSQQQANRFSHAAHGFFTRDGTDPAELIAIGRAQLAQYETIRFETGLVDQAKPVNGGFEITLSGHSAPVQTKKLLLATGLKDVLPQIAGIEPFWGRSIFHCPYCDGWEQRDKAVAIIADAKSALHVAKLLNVLTHDLVVCTHGDTSLEAADRALLHARGIELIETPIARIEGHETQLETMIFEDGQRLRRESAFVRLTSVQHSALASQLGCVMTENDLVQVDEFGHTSVAGVYAAGDLSSRFRQLIAASMQGASAGIGINTDLIAEDFQAAP